MPTTPETITRVFDILDYAQAKYPTDQFCNYKRGDSWISFATKDVNTLSDKLAAGLIASGVKAGDLVSIIGYNCPEWNIVDFGIQKAGAVSIPCYHNLSEVDYVFILSQAQPKLIFCGSLEVYQNIDRLINQLPYQPRLVCLQQYGAIPYWGDMVDQATTEALEVVMSNKASIQPNQLCTILYTSGTTGSPNGVMLSHANIVANVQDCAEHIPVKPGDRFLSFLPISHALERTVLYVIMFGGVQIWYAEGIDSVAASLKEVKPHLFTTVPRMLEKVYDRIIQRGYDQKGIKRLLFFWALHLAQQYRPGKPRTVWYDFQLRIARKLVFSKWQEALGGNLRVVVSGGAALQDRLGSVFWGAGIPIMEGYGMTEASPVISVNHLLEANNRVATLGLPLRRCLVKLSDEGELMVKGPNVFMGYFQNPELTARVLDAEGWLSTGDIVEWVEDRFLKIKDRKKDLFKTSGGMYIPPTQLELMLKESMVVEQAIVVGENQKFPAALLTVSWENLRSWAAIHGLVWTNDIDMLNHPEVKQKYEREVAGQNEKLTAYKQIKKFVILPDTWTVESGELTVTMKVKRRVVIQQYAAHIAAMYAE